MGRRGKYRYKRQRTKWVMKARNHKKKKETEDVDFVSATLPKHKSRQNKEKKFKDDDKNET